MARDPALPAIDRTGWRLRYLVLLPALVALALLASVPADASAQAGDPACTDPAGDQYCPPYDDPCADDPGGDPTSDQYCPPYTGDCLADPDGDPAADQYCPPYTSDCATDPSGGDPAADQYCPPYTGDCLTDPGGGDPAADQYCPPYARACVRQASGTGGAEYAAPSADGYCPPGYVLAAGGGGGSQGGPLPFASADLALGLTLVGALLLAGGMLRRHFARFGGGVRL